MGDVWTAPLLVLGLALVVGIVLVVRVWRDEVGAGGVRQSRREGLVARKDALLERIRELDADRGKLAEAERNRRREALITEATEVLAALDELDAAPDDALVAPPPPSASMSRVGLATGIGGVLVVAVIGLVLGQSSVTRTEGMSMTGNTASDGDQAVEVARAALEANPEDLAALNVLTYDALLRRDAQQAMDFMDRSRAVDPVDPEVLVHLGVLQIMVGMGDRAEATLAQARTARPDLPKAVLWSGVQQLTSDDREAAVVTLTEALSLDLSPVEQRIATQMLAEAKAVPAQVRVRGSVTVAEGAALPQGGILYIIARRSEVAAGPPLAVRRASAAGFPKSFELTDDDMMLGGQWPEQVWLQVRVDADGNPTTKEEADLESELLGPLDAAAEPVTLELTGGLPATSSPSEEADTEPQDAGGARLSGTLSLAEGAAGDGAVIFVMVRRAATASGPPVAALRLPATLPAEFTVTDADMMMGGAWPDEVWVEARLDADGDAMTKTEADLRSELVGPLTAGATGISVVLGGG